MKEVGAYSSASQYVFVSRVVSTRLLTVMDFVIDVQFFRGNENVLIPKEIAVVSLDKGCIAHWLILPVAQVETLNRDARRQNDWLTLHHHGIDYLDGIVSKRCAIKALKEISKRARKIYVRGKEKWAFLNKETARVIINLEYDNDCPALNDLPWNDTFCVHHALKNTYTRFTCALNNAFRLKDWIDENRASKHNEIDSVSLNQENWLSDFDPWMSMHPSTTDLPEERKEFEKKNEQSGVIEPSGKDSSPFGWCVSGRSDPQGVDETDSVHF